MSELHYRGQSVEQLRRRRAWRSGALAGVAIGLLVGLTVGKVPGCVHRVRVVSKLRTSGVGASSGEEPAAPARVR